MVKGPRRRTTSILMHPARLHMIVYAQNGAMGEERDNLQSVQTIDCRTDWPTTSEPMLTPLTMHFFGLPPALHWAQPYPPHHWQVVGVVKQSGSWGAVPVPALETGLGLNSKVGDLDLSPPVIAEWAETLVAADPQEIWTSDRMSSAEMCWSAIVLCGDYGLESACIRM